jgi:hypothetical protein
VGQTELIRLEIRKALLAALYKRWDLLIAMWAGYCASLESCGAVADYCHDCGEFTKFDVQPLTG